MLTGQALGFLNGLISEERAKDPLKKPTAIHVGNIHPDLQEYFLQSQIQGGPILLPEKINNVFIFVNAKYGNDYKVFREGEDFQSHQESAVIIDGKPYWPSKTKRKFMGLIKKGEVK